MKLINARLCALEIVQFIARYYEHTAPETPVAVARAKISVSNSASRYFNKNETCGFS